MLSLFVALMFKVQHGPVSFRMGRFHLWYWRPGTHRGFQRTAYPGLDAQFRPCDRNPGIVIEALHHEHNIFRMGGLRRELPIAFGHS